jgi:hypothetical protein
MSYAKPCGGERWDQRGSKQYLRSLGFNPTLQLRKFKVPRDELAARDVLEELPTSTLMERFPCFGDVKMDSYPPNSLFDINQLS